MKKLAVLALAATAMIPASALAQGGTVAPPIKWEDVPPAPLKTPAKPAQVKPAAPLRVPVAQAKPAPAAQTRPAAPVAQVKPAPVAQAKPAAPAAQAKPVAPMAQARPAAPAAAPPAGVTWVQPAPRTATAAPAAQAQVRPAPAPAPAPMRQAPAAVAARTSPAPVRPAPAPVIVRPAPAPKAPAQVVARPALAPQAPVRVVTRPAPAPIAPPAHAQHQVRPVPPVRGDAQRFVVRREGNGMTQHRAGAAARHPNYHRLERGWHLPRYWRAPQYEVRDHELYRLPRPRQDGRWVRYYEDALLIDSYGTILDSRYDVDWDRHGESWGYDDRGVPSYMDDELYAEDGDLFDERAYADAEGYSAPAYGYPQTYSPGVVTVTETTVTTTGPCDAECQASMEQEVALPARPLRRRR